MKLNYTEIYDNIKKINSVNDLLYLKILPNILYNKLIKLIINTIIETKSIIKGSRSLYNTLEKKLFTPNEYKFKDFDIYCMYPDEFYTLLLSKLTSINLEHIIRKEINPVYSNIDMIYLYNHKFIDLQIIDIHKFNIIPKIEIKKVYYLHPEFMKLDSYFIFSSPILFNILCINKFLNRIEHIEHEYKYIYTPNSLNLKYNIHINKIKTFKTKCIIIGFKAFNLLYNTNINIPFLEIISTNPDIEIKHIKTQININKIEIIHGIDYSIDKFYILYHNNEPLVYLYRLYDCKTYINKNNLLIGTNHLLLYYFNTCIYINKYNKEINSKIVYNISDHAYNSILYKLYTRFNKKINTICIGDLQPAIIRSILNKKK